MHVNSCIYTVYILFDTIFKRDVSSIPAILKHNVSFMVLIIRLVIRFMMRIYIRISATDECMCIWF